MNSPAASDFSAPRELHHPQLTDRNDGLAVMLRVTNLATSRLARFASIAQDSVSQSLLFSNNRFCGLRFQAGLFQALWLFEWPHINFLRSQQVIEQMPVQPTIAKVA